MVADFHLLEDGGTVVRYRDITIGGDENFVQATRAQGGLYDVRNGSGGKNVRLDGFVAELALLLPLTANALGGVAADGRGEPTP